MNKIKDTIILVIIPLSLNPIGNTKITGTLNGLPPTPGLISLDKKRKAGYEGD